MIKFSQLNATEQEKIKLLALKRYQENKNKIYQQIKPSTVKLAPEGEALFTPETWEAGAWKWFLDNSFLL